MILDLLAALDQMFFFLLVLRAGIVGWLMMNSCARSVYLFVIGLLIGVPVLTVAASIPMARYGTGDQFVFGWERYNVLPQVGHMLMTLGVVQVLVWLGRARARRTLVLGLALGLTILSPFMVIETCWLDTHHPNMQQMLFSGDCSFPGQ